MISSIQDRLPCYCKMTINVFLYIFESYCSLPICSIFKMLYSYGRHLCPFPSRAHCLMEPLAFYTRITSYPRLYMLKCLYQIRRDDAQAFAILLSSIWNRPQRGRETLAIRLADIYCTFWQTWSRPHRTTDERSSTGIK